MLDNLYYLFTALSIVIFVLIIYFTEEEMIKEDKTGRQYDASIFIVAPLTVINLILIVILAYQSWNVEVLYFDGSDYAIYTSQMEYMMYVFFGFFLINCALLFKNVAEFFINSFYEPKGRWKY